MNERDAYQLARAFAEVRESRRRGYEYACVSVDAVREPLERGFRWVCTEGELALMRV